MGNKYTRHDGPKNKFKRRAKDIPNPPAVEKLEGMTHADVFKGAILKPDISIIASYLQRYRGPLKLTDQRIYRLAFDLTGINLEDWDTLVFRANKLLGGYL